MKRKISILAFCAMLLVLCSPTQAQHPTKVPRIGYLSSADPARDMRIEGIRAALRALGYIEGQNVSFEYRYAEGRLGRAAELAGELVRLKVDVIMVSGGDPWIRSAMNATKTIPIVLASQGSDPVEAGHVESLARPGGNITGLTSLTTDLGGKRLDLLKEAVPKLVRVAVVYDPATSGTTREVKEVFPAAAHGLKLTIRSWEVRDADGLEKVFAALRKEHPDGLFVPGAGQLMRANLKRITGFALKSRLPSMHTNRVGVEAGGLMYYGADQFEIDRRVAIYVDKLLKGAKPTDLPVERPTKFELIINLKTAKQIGLTIPQSVLYRADKVIQ